MAYVFLAHDLKNNRPVAIKVLKPDVAVSLGSKRFLREMEIAARLQHPHILSLYDSGETNTLLYYVMPYVEGESLADRLRRETQLPVEDSLEIARDVADALAYAHGHGVIHRDIKPDNILLTSGHALVADFGVARAVTTAGSSTATDVGVAVGTPAYMSPEQGTGRRDIDGRSDLYSLGCVVYEMLAGEPPFSGPTAQTLIARHVNERPPSLQIVRPTVSAGIVQVLEKTLAKVPADRFSTAAQFVDSIRALQTGTYKAVRPKRSYRRPLTLAASGLVAAAALLVALQIEPPPPLDPNRIVAYPLVVSGASGADEALVGQDVAYLIVAGLWGRASLRWENGLDLLADPRHLESPQLIATQTKRDLARAKAAGFFVDGRALLTGDSAMVNLSLYSVLDDSIVARVDTAGARVDVRRLGVLAVGELLLSLLPTGESVDPSAVTGRSTEAVQAFVQGERHFHDGNFRDAFEHYRSAVAQDSAFALAALKAARAAAWSEMAESAGGLLQVALRNRESLVPRDLEYARAFEAYLSAQADTAVTHVRHAIGIDPEWPDAWMLLGDTYTHLLPRDSPQDSLAEAALLEAYRKSGGLAPALYHLVEFATRRGDLASASRLLQEFRGGRPDTTMLGRVELVLECARTSPDAIDWREAVEREPQWVFAAANSLAAGGAYPDCARAGWNAVLRYDTSTNRRWSALQGLQSLLSATGQRHELMALLDSAVASGTPTAELFYMLDDLAGADVRAKAVAVADRLLGDFAELSDRRLWFLGVWCAQRDRLMQARAIRDVLQARFQQSRAREVGLLSKSVAAHVALAEGDSTMALRLFESVTPNAARGPLNWRPWESLGGERLALAKLLYARSEYDKADRVAAHLDAPAPVPYLIYLPESLSLRLRIARKLGNQEAAERYEERLRRLGRSDLVPQDTAN
jgi:tetratricopeptide (TPR) repeat protein